MLSKRHGKSLSLLPSKLFELVITEEVARGDRHLDDWVELYDLLALCCDNYNYKAMSAMTPRSQLAIAMVLVGAERVELFGQVFDNFHVWESTGGCFWVCAEELFRHHILQQIRQTITISEDFLNSHEVVIALRALVVKRIPEVMPRVQHQLLHRRIQELRCQLLTFFNRLEGLSIHAQMDRFEEYAQATSLPAFVTWFLNWAKETLSQPETTQKHKTREKVGIKIAHSMAKSQSSSRVTTEPSPELALLQQPSLTSSSLLSNSLTDLHQSTRRRLFHSPVVEDWFDCEEHMSQSPVSDASTQTTDLMSFSMNVGNNVIVDELKTVEESAEEEAMVIDIPDKLQRPNESKLQACVDGSTVLDKGGETFSMAVIVPDDEYDYALSKASVQDDQPQSSISETPDYFHSIATSKNEIAFEGMTPAQQTPSHSTAITTSNSKDINKNMSHDVTPLGQITLSPMKDFSCDNGYSLSVSQPSSCSDMDTMDVVEQIFWDLFNPSLL